jgi:hypothetical protein
MATTFNAALGALATVQRTHAAHASALGALERAFDAEMVMIARRIRRYSDVSEDTLYITLTHLVSGFLLSW